METFAVFILALFSISIRPATCAETFSDTLNEFALKIFGQVCSNTKPNGNIVISPFSIALAMGMLHQGTSGQTESEISSNIFKGMTKDEVAKHFKHLDEVELIDLLRPNPNVTINLANRVYVQADVAVKREFTESLQMNFNSSVKGVDFHNKVESANLINSWVAEATSGKIKTLLEPDQVQEESSLLILNAIYLKGHWLHPFQPHLTRRENFLSHGKTPTEVEMMHGSFSIYRSIRDKISDDLPFQSFILQYQGKRLSMLVLLPSPEIHLDDVIKRVQTNEILKKIYSETTKSAGQVTLGLPKFKISKDFHLLGVLKELGIKKWDELSNTLNEGFDRLHVSEVMQKAVIEVNENSTEAAAVSSILIMNRSLVMRKEITVNRPFAYIIRDDITELILFIGKVEDPSKN